MGHAPTAKLIYGYDLGSAGDGWNFAEYDTDEYEIKLPWYLADGDEFTEQAMRWLRAELAGFTETDWRADGFFKRQQAATDQVGVEFEYYGYEMCCNALAVFNVRVDWGSELVDLADLVTRPAAQGWDTKLAAAINALGITPTQERPAWILAASYG